MTKIFMAVAAGLFAFACTTDTTDDLGVKTEVVGGGTEITLSLEESRTQLGEKADGLYPLHWSEGDKISVNGVESSEAIIGENPATATFTTTVDAEVFNIAYPAAPEGQVLFAAKQNHVVEGNTFESGVSTMYGVGAPSSGFKINHLTGVLKIGIKGEAVLSKAQISTIDRAPIAGAFDIDFATGELTATTASKDVIEYSFGEAGLQLSADAQYIHVAVPAGKYEELYITLYEQGNSGNVMYATIKAGESKPLTAGNVREFKSDITYAPNATLFVIDSVEKLQAFKAAIEAEGGLTSDAVLTEDIDMTGVEWTPINGESYVNTLIGNGYAIKGLTAPLFATTSASFKGVHLEDVNISTNDRPTCGALVCTITSTDAVTPKVENCSVSGTFTIENKTLAPTAAQTVIYGVVVGNLIGGTMDGCVNHATMTVKQLRAEGNTQNIDIRIGGVIGQLSNFTKSDSTALYAELHNSTNRGDISYEDIGTTYYLQFGGVLGASLTANIGVKTSSCTNYGDITFSAKTNENSYLGGVLGFLRSQNNTGAIAEKHNNYGKITITETAQFTNELNCGGVIGHAQSTTVDQCHNWGEIEFKPGSIIYELDLGGILGDHTTRKVNDVDQTSYYIYDSTNNAEIKMGASSVSGKAASVRFGGITGYSQARFYRNINNAKITMSGNLNTNGKRGKDGTYVVAGVVGYKTHGSIYACQNHGEIVVSGSTTELHASTISQLKIGGIVCYSAQDLDGSNSVNTGKITVSGEFGCEVNVGGMAAYSYNTSNSISNETCGADIVLSGKFNKGLIVGGVLSWAHYSTKGLTYEGTIEVTKDAEISTLCYIGGCIGRLAIPDSTARSAQNMTNNGTIKFNGTSNAVTYVAGCIGVNNKESSSATKIHTISNVVNNGQIIFGSTSSTPSENAYVAGCVARSDNNITTATNNGKITFDGEHLGGNHYISGCISEASSGTFTDMTNNADIETLATATFKSPRISGIGGYISGTIKGTNLGCLNVASTSTDYTILSGFAYRGGLIDCTNGSATDKTKGVINFTGTTGSETLQSSLQFAGLVFDTYNNISNSVNYGDMNIGGASHYTLYGGGVTYNGPDSNCSITSCSNYGNITISATIGDNVHAKNKGADCFIGGLAYAIFGSTDAKTFTDCHNHGNITVTDDCTIGGAVRIGGLFANPNETDTKLVLDGCSNSGNLSINGKCSVYEKSNFVVGGCIADMAKATVTIKNGLVNSGNVSVGAENTKNYINCGGVFGTLAADAILDISGYFVNTGNVTYTGKSNGYLRVGGVIAIQSQAVSTKMINTGNVTATGTWDTSNADGAYIGGIAGKTTASVANAQCYCNIKAIGYKGVGMITGWSHSDSVVVSDSAIGGTICRETQIETDDGGEEIKKEITETISAENLHKYVYGNEVDASVVTSVSVLTSAPSTEQPAPAPEEPEATPEA